MPINFKNIQTTGNREYNVQNIAKINEALSYLSPKQRASVLASIIEESGGNPRVVSKNGTYQGLLQMLEQRNKEIEWPAFMPRQYGDGGQKTSAFSPIKHPVIPKVEGDQQAVNWLAIMYKLKLLKIY